MKSMQLASMVCMRKSVYLYLSHGGDRYKFLVWCTSAPKGEITYFADMWRPGQFPRSMTTSCKGKTTSSIHFPLSKPMTCSFLIALLLEWAESAASLPRLRQTNRSPPDPMDLFTASPRQVQGSSPDRTSTSSLLIDLPAILSSCACRGRTIKLKSASPAGQTDNAIGSHVRLICLNVLDSLLQE